VVLQKRVKTLKSDFSREGTTSDAYGVIYVLAQYFFISLNEKYRAYRQPGFYVIF
jgi:hypothetical protein